MTPEEEQVQALRALQAHAERLNAANARRVAKVEHLLLRDWPVDKLRAFLLLKKTLNVHQQVCVMTEELERRMKALGIEPGKAQLRLVK